MGFLAGLKKFNQVTSKIENSQQEFKRLTDKSQRDENDIRCIRKSKIWSTINIILSIPVGVAIYFIIRMFLSFSILSVGAFFGLLILGWGYGTSLVKAKNYTADEAPSLGAVILSYVAFGMAILAIVAAVFCTFILPSLF